MTMRSEKSLSEWRGNLTLFDGFYSTIPADEVHETSWGLVVHSVAPAHGPAIVQEKENAPYFITCSLRVAPYIGKTLERTKSIGSRSEGKQRSGGHVTPSNILVFDLDGVERTQLDELVERVRANSLTALVYSTHSHGRTDKPRIRARVMLPIDERLEQKEYDRAWHGVASLLFSGIEVDASSRRVHQQQGIWVTASDRKHLAFKHDFRGGLIDAQAAIDAGPTPKPKPVVQLAPFIKTDNVERLEMALPWLDANDTGTWHSLMMAFKATAPLIGTDAALSLALRYSAQGSDEATERNDEARYDPSIFFDNATPHMPPEAGVATLCANARDVAEKELVTALNSGKLVRRSSEAAKYLAKHHSKRFEEIRGTYGNR